MKANNVRPLLLAVTFIDLLGVGILLPIMPFIALELHATPVQIGALAAVFPFCQMLVMPMWGHLADRWGAKPILLISLAGTTLAMALFALSRDYSLLLASRALAGITAGTLGVVRGALTEPDEPERTQKNMQLFGAAQGVGFLLGPLLGSLFSMISMRAPLWIASAVSLGAFAFLWRLPQVRLAPATHSDWTLEKKWRHMRSQPGLALITGSYFFVYLAFALLFISFPLFLNESYHYDSRQTALYFSLLSICAVAAQLGVFPLLLKFFMRSKILIAAFLTLIVGVELLGRPFGGWQTAGFLAITSLGLFLTIPGLMTEIGLRSKAEDKSFIASFTESMSGLARLLGTGASGWMIARAGLMSAFHASALMTALALITYVLANKLHQRQSH